MLHPEFPVVVGRYQMTPDWAVTLPRPFNRRTEDGSLVFWRPGFLSVDQLLDDFERDIQN